MVYSPTGSSDLFLIPGCMTSNFLYLNFSTLYSSSLWRTDTIVFAKLNTLPLNRGFTVSPICPEPVTGPFRDGWETMRKQSEL